MRCRTCEYRLWNLAARVCPECGASFKPSDYEFAVNSVQFCCPHCNQDYYGTGDKGHLAPNAFNCVACGQPIHMDQMVLRPTRHVEEQQTEVDQNAWLARKKRGVIKAWFAMIGRGMVGPGRLMRATPESSSHNQALWYAILTTTLVYSCAIGATMLFPLVGALVSGGGGGFGVGLRSLGFVLVWLVPIVGTLVFLILWGLAAHLVLVLTTPNRQRLRRTYHALCYSAGTSAVAGVPCVGFYLIPVAWVWWTVSAVLMLKQAHQISGRRASLAVVVLPILGMLGFGSLAGYGFFQVITAAPTIATGSSAVIDQPKMQAVAQAVLTHAQQNAGLGPDHVIRLLHEGQLDSSFFRASSSTTTDSDVRAANFSLLQFSLMGPHTQQSAVDQAAQSLPTGTTAYRMGDLVFTYHGIDLIQGDPELWIVIMWPESMAAATNLPVAVSGGGTSRPTVATSRANVSPGATVLVGRADGSVTEMSSAGFGFMLAEQNKLRASLNLPPIPDPSTITHSKPAVWVAKSEEQRAKSE